MKRKKFGNIPVGGQFRELPGDGAIREWIVKTENTDKYPHHYNATLRDMLLTFFDDETVEVPDEVVLD